MTSIPTPPSTTRFDLLQRKARIQPTPALMAVMELPQKFAVANLIKSLREIKTSNSKTEYVDDIHVRVYNEIDCMPKLMNHNRCS